MPNYILFDDSTRLQLLPFTHTRPIADVRCGIFTMRERWEYLLKTGTSSLTEQYMQSVFPISTTEDDIYINGRVFATSNLLEAINKLCEGEKLVKDDLLIAARFSTQNVDYASFAKGCGSLKPKLIEKEVRLLTHIWDIFSQNDIAIRTDFDLITKGRKSLPIPDNVMVSGEEHIFIEEGGKINMGCIINATRGPVYIGKDAEILEGAMVHGPLALCEHGVIKMGAKIYGATTIGPGCKVGGEISNVVFFANSNKGHDGYLGNAVIGEWCNLGADTNCSNLKNNYDEIKVWSEIDGALMPTGLIFCGLLMGDHSKSGINTMFNTGTVVGVSANIYGGGFPEKFIPSFSWGGSDGFTTYQFSKALETANRMMARRGKKLSENEEGMYMYIFEQTASQRK